MDEITDLRIKGYFADAQYDVKEGSTSPFYSTLFSPVILNPKGEESHTTKSTKKKE